ncbi:MAG: DUF3768 domain-containing protein [Caldilineaceae bacterium]
METQNRSKQIAELNDIFRRTIGLPLSQTARSIQGKMFFTAGIAALPPQIQADIVLKVMEYDTFTPENDPWGEHDFGSFEQADVGTVYWKIDYYDLNLEHGSEDPIDLEQTMRVLTVMFAAEY